MNIVTTKQFQKNKKQFYAQIKKGAVFIYPTDTIYGIGCDATNNTAVKKARQYKKRDAKPFSIIAPSKAWIRKNCIVSKESEKWLKKLPGPYTILLKLKNKKAIAADITPTDIVGVRIPNNWSKNIARTLKKPIVSTSANISGKPHMTSTNDMNKDIAKKVDFIINEGKKSGTPSTIITEQGKKISRSQ